MSLLNGAAPLSCQQAFISDQTLPEPTDYPPVNTTDPQLTLRAIVTGLVIGALLAPCNIYSGLKIGWAFNMSIAAALLGLAFWRLLQRFGARPFSLPENTINQTSASAAAAIVSSGLAAPIPALTLITGQSLSWIWLACWLFTVSLLGVVVAIAQRQQLLLRDRLVFPAGVATAETLREIYGRGDEAVARVRVLVMAASISALLKLGQDFVFTLPRLVPAIALPGRSVTLHNLGLMPDPSLLLFGFGAIIGLRVGLSLLLGALLAWGVLAPWLLAQGWVSAGEAGAIWFSELVEWLLWPGVTLMVSASLTTVVLSWRPWRQTAVTHAAMTETDSKTGSVPRLWFVAVTTIAVLLVVAAQTGLFGISVTAAIIAVLLSFGLAVVAARVAGETGITPIGAIGKVTQVVFAWVSPGNISNNLMAANVTGGATDQGADLLHDLKAGLLLGVQARLQMLAQIFGIAAGALAGSAAYLVLIPDPQTMLLTPEWPAPAVATWKAVAEVLQQGIDALPPATLPAIAVAALAGIISAWLNNTSRWASRWLPSAPAMGLAFVIPASNSISLCLGALLATVISRYAHRWGQRFLLALAAGLVAGESLAGMAGALVQLLLGR